ncbi:hypothetical protein ISU10_21095 [Nocardioides agariphilus]|uniref:Uncharacterized protein n=1 Tax=Nocardioides agariphilus TaxID=433664 RepID=A0A930YRA0_9ACTN|nr:hypothetical protein [Nocardioides agariphilus]MBF4770280.1 hypothetical protein [Nocardioides agariphilus]
MFENIFGNLIADLILLGIVSVGGVLLARWRPWRRNRVKSIKQTTRRVHAETVETLREQVVMVAKARGIREAETWNSRSANPVVVTFTVGVPLAYFRSMQSYQEAARSGRINPAVDAKFNVKPPDPISTWSGARCREWLDEHTD